MVPALSHGLVLVYGPGPGLGKSTLGRALAGRLTARGYPTRFFEEHEASVHPAFRDYVRSVEAGRARDIAALVGACRRFVAGLEDRRPEVSVLDSVLPCWDWLYSAGCSDEGVSGFSRTLAGLLSPLNPVLVYVEGDLDAALARAVGKRGEGWVLDLAENRTGRRDPDALGAYFRRLRACAERMLALWPHRVLRVDTGARDLRSCVDRVVSTVGTIRVAVDWREHIHSDPEILSGKPILKGTRLPVDLLLELLANGWREEQLFDSYPNLTRDSLRAVFAFAAESTRDERAFELRR